MQQLQRINHAHAHTHTHTTPSKSLQGITSDTAIHTLVLDQCLASVKTPLLVIHSADQSTALHDVNHALNTQHLDAS